MGCKRTAGRFIVVSNSLSSAASPRATGVCRDVCTPWGDEGVATELNSCPDGVSERAKDAGEANASCASFIFDWASCVDLITGLITVSSCTDSTTGSSCESLVFALEGCTELLSCCVGTSSCCGCSCCDDSCNRSSSAQKGCAGAENEYTVS